MNVYIVTDMEGVSGVVTPEDVQPSGARYAMARAMLTAEVNAAVRGAHAAGASHIAVLNGHGAASAYNINYDDIEPPAVHIAGSPWHCYLPGLDASVDIVFQIGAHARSGTPGALLEHTMSSVTWVSCRLDGDQIGEMQLIAAFAAHYGARMALVTGDAAACAEARASFPSVLTVETKRGLSRTAGVLRPCGAVLSEIESAAERAVSSCKRMPVLPRRGPCALEICFSHTPSADHLDGRPGVERLDGVTVRITGRDIVEAVGRLY